MSSSVKQFIRVPIGKFLHLANFFYTTNGCDGCDKYQVWRELILVIWILSRYLLSKSVAVTQSQHKQLFPFFPQVWNSCRNMNAVVLWTITGLKQPPVVRVWNKGNIFRGRKTDTWTDTQTSTPHHMSTKTTMHKIQWTHTPRQANRAYTTSDRDMWKSSTSGLDN